jgi:hypothetical protein
MDYPVLLHCGSHCRSFTTLTSKEEYKKRIRELAKVARRELEVYSNHADDTLEVCYPQSKKLLDAIEGEQ